MKILDDVKSYNTINDLLLYNNMLNYSKNADVNKPYIHYIDGK
jgi:hypothetical protein